MIIGRGKACKAVVGERTTLFMWDTKSIKEWSRVLGVMSSFVDVEGVDRSCSNILDRRG